VKFAYVLDAMRGARKRHAASPTLRTTPRWQVDVRVPSTDWYRRGLELVEDARFRVVDLNPPSAGPEVQITLVLEASRDDVAERVAARVLARYGFGTVLASRARRAR